MKCPGTHCPGCGSGESRLWLPAAIIAAVLIAAMAPVLLATLRLLIAVVIGGEVLAAAGLVTLIIVRVREARTWLAKPEPEPMRYRATVIPPVPARGPQEPITGRVIPPALSRPGRAGRPAHERDERVLRVLRPGP